MMNRFCFYFLACRRFVVGSHASTSILSCHLPKRSFSSHSNSSVINAHLQSPFANFALTKFNLPSADIAYIFKSYPMLERLQTLENVEYYVHLLSKHGVNQHQIAKIMRNSPALLVVSAERIVEPKIQLLIDSGFEGEHLVKLLTVGSQVLTVSLHDGLLPRIMFLKTLFQSTVLFIKATLRYPRILMCNVEKTLKPSIVFWEGWGVCGKELANMLSAAPRLLTISSLTPAQLDFIQNIGADRERKMFKHVLAVVATSRMETLEAKIQNLQLSGLSTGEITELFRASPRSFTLSKEAVRKKVEFILKTMEVPVGLVAKHSWWLALNLEKVMKPRFVVFKKIESMNNLYHLKLKSLNTVLRMPEVRFVREIIKGHPESQILYSIYEEAIANVTTCKKGSD